MPGEKPSLSLMRALTYKRGVWEHGGVEEGGGDREQTERLTFWLNRAKQKLHMSTGRREPHLHKNVSQVFVFGMKAEGCV